MMLASLALFLNLAAGILNFTHVWGDPSPIVGTLNLAAAAYIAFVMMDR